LFTCIVGFFLVRDVPHSNESTKTTPQKRMRPRGSSAEDGSEVEVGVEPPNLMARRPQGNKKAARTDHKKIKIK
jgi:hypothetical protein